MIGALFTGLIHMIETQYSPAVADAILTPPGLASGGVYTSVGVYEYREFDQLLERLTSHTGKARAEVLRQFGRFHFHRLLRLYPHLVSGLNDTFSLLARVHRPIHATVTNLHANAEVPHLEYSQESTQRARLVYRSQRPLTEMAAGLIDGAIAHFKEPISVERIDYPASDGASGVHACFILTKTTVQ
jgi:hypothetical protein